MASWMVVRILKFGRHRGAVGPDSMQNAEPFAPVLVGMGVVIIGLIAERILIARKK